MKYLLILLTLGIGGYFYWQRDTRTFDAPESIETTAWAQGHIEKQLAQLTKPISYADIEKAFNHLKVQNDTAVLFSIQDKKVTTKSCPVRNWKATSKSLNFFIKEFARRGLLKNSAFILMMDDHADNVSLPPEIAHVPIFVLAKSLKAKEQTIRLLIPDGHTLRNWPHIYKDLKFARKKSLWRTKKAFLFWRGTTSDFGDNIHVLSPRAHLVSLSTQYPNLIDAQFTTRFNTRNDKEFEKRIRSLNKTSDKILETDHLPFKYQIAMDGITSTFPGYLWRLGSGCLTLKQDSPNIQWFYDLLKPNVHYVAVERDLSDLVERLEFAKAHDEKMQQIAENALKIVESELIPGKVCGYFISLLNAYAKHLH